MTPRPRIEPESTLMRCQRLVVAPTMLPFSVSKYRLSIIGSFCPKLIFYNSYLIFKIKKKEENLIIT
jgi:hypothetical protein